MVHVQMYIYALKKMQAIDVIRNFHWAEGQGRSRGEVRERVGGCGWWLVGSLVCVVHVLRSNNVVVISNPLGPPPTPDTASKQANKQTRQHFTGATNYF
jgi:hypothetical protein